ncbi:hypothetical protein [Roseateles microcysteis]|uniref:hypothetical protein n=1 Tax=Roseateles microcysteis TaxID=3119057 RepID=UPI002FE6BFCA
MNRQSKHQILLPLALASSFVISVAPSLAGPGAHGPNGEHLDTPSSTLSGGKASPRIEAKSELFELVGTLAGGELSILIDRFATNEPLLKAEVEVETGGTKAKAKFHADVGDFSVDDEAFLKKLSTPGEHALVITVMAGEDTDLLDGVLRVTEPVSAEAHAHGHGEHDDHAEDHGRPWGRWALGAGAALAALGGLIWHRRRTTSSFGNQSNGGLA